MKRGCKHSLRLTILKEIYNNPRIKISHLLGRTPTDIRNFKRHLNFLIESKKVKDKGQDAEKRFTITTQGMKYFELLIKLKSFEKEDIWSKW